MKFYEMEIEVIEDEGNQAIYLSTYDIQDDRRVGVIMSPEQASIIAQQLINLSAEII